MSKKDWSDVIKDKINRFSKDEIIFTKSFFSNNLSNKIIDAEWFSDLIPILNNRDNKELYMQ